MAAVPTIGRADRAPAGAASPDAQAEVLYQRLYDRVYGYCLYRLGSREEAEDAAQMTFVHALRGLRRGVIPRVEAAWVFAIAKNVCLERYQSRGRSRDREVLLEPSALESTAGEEHQSEDVARLREALTRIPKQQREAVLLREWRGFSYREIAAEMGLSLAAVETLIFRARRSLVQHLSDEPETKRARLAHGFALGPMAAALKSAFAGSAAKIGLTAAALAAAGALAGGAFIVSDQPTDTSGPPAVETPADVPPAVEPSFLRPAAADSSASQADTQATRRPSREKKEEASPAVLQETPLDAVGTGAHDLVEQAGGLVEKTTKALEPVVDPLESTLAPVLQTAAGLPELQLPLETSLPLP